MPHRSVRAFGCASAHRRGQAILESLIVLLVILFFFFIFFDFIYGAVVQLHLNNAAARVARAETVGFNRFHCLKAARVAMLPVSGKRLVPDDLRTVEGGVNTELALVRTYLQAETEEDARGILNYERWGSLTQTADHDGIRTTAYVAIETPMTLPWQLGAMFGAKVSPEGLRKRSSTWQIEDHASYYLKAAGER